MSVWSELTDLPEGDGKVIDDFDKRYTNSYLLITVNYKTIPVMYKGYNDQQKHVFSDINGLQYELGNKTNKQVSVWFPKMGCYNIKNQACIFWIVPARQWKRAPCSENTQLYSYNKTFNPLHLGTFTDCYNNVYPTYEDALKLLDTQLSVAISINYALIKLKQIYLYHHDVPIGVLNNEQFVPIIPEFEQDIADFYRKYKT